MAAREIAVGDDPDGAVGICGRGHECPSGAKEGA